MTTPASTSQETESAEADRFAEVTALDGWVWAGLLAAWAYLDWSNLQSSYAYEALPAMLARMGRGQQEAADIGAQYVDRQAEALGVPPATERVRPQSFSGVASNGRSMEGLLTQPLIKAYTLGAAGAEPSLALAGGLDQLKMIAVTQVHDAAREAENVAMNVNDEIRGYIRVVEPGACDRCIVLAGKFYRKNAGFRRHPQCRCFRHMALRADDPYVKVSDPREVFDKMSREEQDRRFTQYGAEAIRNGADIGQVVNARKGMETTTGSYGRETKARRDVYGQNLYTTTAGSGTRRGRNEQIRLMPQSIIELAKGDQKELVRLLRVYGYIR